MRTKIEEKLETIGDVLCLINDTLKGDLSNPIYGIRRNLESASTSWVRTDEAKTLNALATKNGAYVENDFNNIYPWSEIKTVNILNNEVVAEIGDVAFAFDGSNGDVMTYIPRFFLKRWQDGVNEYIQIARRRFEGAIEIEPFYVGRYTTSNGTKSISGVLSSVSKNIATFRNEAMAKGEGWHQLDWHLFVLQMLYLVEYANGDSQAMLGKGVASDSAQHVSGECDSLGMFSGCLVDDNKSSVIYRGVENLFGNIWQFVDGISIKDWQAYVCYDYTKYANDVFAEPYEMLGYVNSNTNGNPKKLGYDENNPLVQIATEVGTSSYGDYYYQNSGNRIVICGGSWGFGSPVGFFCLNCYYGSSLADSYFGSRLIKSI